MVRIGFAVVLVASLATTAHAQPRGGGGRMGMAMGGMGGGCAGGANGYGVASSMGNPFMTPPNAMGFNGMGAGGFNPQMMGVGSNPLMMCNSFAGPNGFSSYGVANGWANPYAAAGYGFGNPGSIGSMNGMSRGSASFRRNGGRAAPPPGFSSERKRGQKGKGDRKEKGTEMLCRKPPPESA